ncbi:neither inactivation nor afterpotential protein C [Daktulosphaira vitifoliae]|uniref:neither inactivation nor afterpotential protein C n=1 Tax=Daktulosphaira vitifoliae TaxID=58002 RepID=UPI0021AA0804|nr:neither inactivation nor afterpotential protein C [Daktulosphaira vitifoliae]
MVKLDSGPLDLNSLPNSGDRFTLGKLLGSGICSNVYEAIDSQTGQNVAVKIQNMKDISDLEKDINEEYRILRDLSSHPNMPDFYGAYGNKRGNELWFVMELCEGGTIVDIINGLLLQNKKLKENQIGYILRELIKVICYLHENNVVHRDIRGSNILLTKDGHVKLVDFGQSRELQSSGFKTNTCIGSPAWMAPEIVLAEYKDKSEDSPCYDKKIDVWATGITAIELGDGKPPFLDIHPTRALFQIARNPPPGLFRPSNWSQLYNDFIAECLEKNPDHRPFAEELLEHPFISEVSDNTRLEIKSIMESIVDDVSSIRKPEVRIIKNGYLKTGRTEPARPMHFEDLAALKEVSEESVLRELQNRHSNGQNYTFVGDVLLYLNPNVDNVTCEKKNHYRYQNKCRSDNEPHIFSVADAAYQDMLHHEQPQCIIMAGETKSGKTFNYSKLIEHLIFLGEQSHGKVNQIGLKIKSAIDVIQSFGNAANKYHMNSTRYVNHTQVTYSSTGKLSGAIFFVYQLEKWRVTNVRNEDQQNFHIFYDFLAAAKLDEMLEKYHLDKSCKYRYLSSNKESIVYGQGAKVSNFNKLLVCLKDALEFTDDQVNTLWRVLAAILNLGELKIIKDEDDGEVKIENSDLIPNVADLLGVDAKKLAWCLFNYCVVVNGAAVRRKHTVTSASECIKVFAQTLYARLFDWIVNVINMKLAFSRAIFGDRHVVCLMDMFGFECFRQNNLEQLFVNCLNEQMQYHFIQKTFTWELQDMDDERIESYGFQYLNNKPIIDALMNNPEGIFYVFDEAAKNCQDYTYITNELEKNPKEPYVQIVDSKSFSVAHYSGLITYQLKDLIEKNRDFLTPEVIETIRGSKDSTLKELFTNRLTKCGNLTASRERSRQIVKPPLNKISRWGVALVAEKYPIRKYNTESRGEYSQTHKIRTASAVYRASSVEILRSLVDTTDQKNGIHFVRCIRTTLTDEPLSFQPEVVRQQLKALSVVETVLARQNGYSCRVSFNEFIQRYKFLAFDFYENVEETRENCRLLLIRLKMEGWKIGKTKVFLKYYHEEYLSRLYEIQVKKVIKVQSMLRSFITKRKIAPQLAKQQSGAIESKTKSKAVEHTLSEENAAIVIQKHYQGYMVRKNLAENNQLNSETRKKLRAFCKKWKGKSIYQVLLLDRANKLQEVVYFSFHVHLYNQHVLATLNNTNQGPVKLGKIITTTNVIDFLGVKKCYPFKVPFKLDHITVNKRHKFDFEIDNSIDESNWDSPLNRFPETRTAFRILKFSFAVRDQSTQVDIGGKMDGTDYVEINNHLKFGIGRIEDNKKRDEMKSKRNALVLDYDNRKTLVDRKDGNADLKFNQKSIKKSERINPVLEMQFKGKQFQSVNEDQNDAPYNFQAMLKKTNHHRSSLDGHGNLEYASSAVGIISRNTNSPSTNNYQQSKQMKNEQNQRLTDISSIKAELVPGVIIEGSSYDL